MRRLLIVPVMVLALAGCGSANNDCEDAFGYADAALNSAAAGFEANDDFLAAARAGDSAGMRAALDYLDRATKDMEDIRAKYEDAKEKCSGV